MQKIYTRDISFEAPNSPGIFREKWQPTVDMDVSNLAESIGDNLFDVVLTITVDVKLGEQTAYLAEVRQAGIFLLRQLPGELLNRVLATTCPNILLPFARELIAELVTRAGFPQFLIQPINFDALYEQHLSGKQQDAGNGRQQDRQSRANRD